MGVGVVMALNVMGLRRMCAIVVVLMAVVPQLGLVQQEKKHQPQEQCQKQIMGAGLTLKSLSL